MSGKKTAIIIGAGPAGLTAAYELLEKTDIKPIILEADNSTGGISRTVHFKGNYIDIGGHRFFSKSKTVMDWWLNIFPLQNETNSENDNVMLLRERKSRIFFLGKFFDYPVKINPDTIKKLGFTRIVKILFGYLQVKIFPIKKPKNLEEFFISRFGKELYNTFFKEYTEKVWGEKCTEISAEWGRQRIKGLSVSKTILNALKNIFISGKNIRQKKTETSLISKFLYPKYGPGQFWTYLADLIKKKGGEIKFNHRVIKLRNKELNISEIIYSNKGKNNSISCDYVISSMPVKDLIKGMQNVPHEISKVASGLIYRDFITVGLLIPKSALIKRTDDLWIYIQEKNIRAGRLQIFNNWSPYMVKDKNNVWLGLEYFCNSDDDLWKMNDVELKNIAEKELIKMGFIKKQSVSESIVIKMPKTYPAYFGSYNKFFKIRNYTDKIENLYLIGRNGMHKYNNMDHSMLTAIKTVKNISENILNKSAIWNVNTEQEFIEE